MNSLIEKDLSLASKDFVYDLWRGHLELKTHCCFEQPINYATFLRNMITFEAGFYEFVTFFTKSNLRVEISRLCPDKEGDPFCSITYALPIIDTLSTRSESSWIVGAEVHRSLIKLKVLHLLRQHPSEYGSLEETITSKVQQEIISNVINGILTYIKHQQYTELEELHKEIPRFNTYTRTGNGGCNSDNICIFMKTVAQVDNYLKEIYLYKTHGKKRVLLNTGTDYTEFLKQKQLDRILQMLTEQQLTSLSIAKALKTHLTNQFSELTSYYKRVESFNGAIAEADIGYIVGRLDTFKGRITSVVGTFTAKMSILLFQMFIGAGLEVIHSTITLALSIADACNPMGFIFGGADPKDLMDAVAEVANAAAQLTQSIAVQSAWGNVNTKAIEINDKFNNNRDFLETVKELAFEESKTREDFEKASNTFLEQYNNYDPQVLPDDLVGMTSLWSGLVEAACGVTDSFNTAAGIAAAAVISGQNLCVDLPVLADRMGELYENIYDYQFDMMDALAEYTRAKVTIDAAKEITAELTTITNEDPDDEKTLTALEITGGLTFVTYKTHLLHAINCYCNILEYSEGGQKPSECKGPDTDLSLLLSRTFKECTYQTLDYYQVPTAPSGPNDLAYVDISELYKGATVNFKIPNSQWLIDHKWIREDERDMAFFVQQFDVYLPIEPEHPVDFNVNADPILKNKLIYTSNATEYMIVPHLPLASEYYIGPKRMVCRADRKFNPYTQCKPDGSFICPVTIKTSRSLYPSLYSHWAITVNGGENLTPPTPATDLSVLFGVKLCKVVSPYEHTDYVTDLAGTQQVNECCPTGQYRIDPAAECSDCPTDSTSALQGYYCEK